MTTSSSSIAKILPELRKIILELRAKNSYSTYGLSHLVSLVSKTDGADRTLRPSRYTSRSPKKFRGHVQLALSILAKEGLVFERQRPEGGVAPYEHGERDKRFCIRIAQDEARRRLEKMR